MNGGRGPVDLRVDSLEVEVATGAGWVRVVDDVSITVGPGEIHGLVGESGSGKSLTAMAIMGLLRSEAQVRVSGGTVDLGGTDLLSLSDKALRQWQGTRLSMVFQEPMKSLNPAFTVGDQIAETMRYHLGISKREASSRAIGLLQEVGIPNPRLRLQDYPHQFSGGMRQRIMLAIALSCEPALLIADEPTTALDVTVQAQILDLVASLVQRHEMSVLFITHDLGVVSDLCDRLTVMYAGQVVESGSVSEVIGHPKHPYTEGLLSSVPKGRGAPLAWIKGSPPAPTQLPSGCRFHPRCPYAIEECRSSPVDLSPETDSRQARCVRVDDLTLVGAS